MQFFSKTRQLLGAHYTRDWSRGRPRKKRAVEIMKEPSSRKEVRAFLGLLGYYRKFIPGFGKTAEPRCSLLNKSNKFEWSTECKNAVTDLKKKLLDAPVFGYPNNRDPYTLTTDALLTRIGAFLTQKQGTEEKVLTT